MAAKRILISGVALVPVYHGIYNALVNPYIKGPMFEPNEEGIVSVTRNTVLLFQTDASPPR